MRVLIRLFAFYREQAGVDRLEITLPDQATTAQAIVALRDQRPTLPPDFRPHLIAVNEEFASLEFVLHEGDEVALYPPVSGGVDAAVTENPVDSRIIANMVHLPSNGAVATFEGVTRDETGGSRVLHLEYEAHDSMANKVLAQVLEETIYRYGVSTIAARHRLGRLEIGDVSLVVAVGSPHRAEAFLAAQYAVDRIKQIVPIWKKEFFADGSVWVGMACDEDHGAQQLDNSTSTPTVLRMPSRKHANNR